MINKFVNYNKLIKYCINRYILAYMGKQCGSSSRNKGDAAGNDTLGKKHKKGSKKDGANPSDIKAEIDHDVVQTEATAMSTSMAP